MVESVIEWATKSVTESNQGQFVENEFPSDLARATEHEFQAMNPNCE